MSLLRRLFIFKPEIWRPATIATIVCLVRIVMVLYRPWSLDYLDDKVFDRLAATVERVSSREVANQQSVIVDIDESSLSRIGSWPWPRNVMAQMVNRVFDSGASVVALDIVFPERDLTSSNDLLLAKALARGPSVGAFDLVFDTARNRMTSCDKAPQPLLSTSALVSQHVKNFALADASSLTCDTPVIDSGVTRAGFLNAPRDRDGVHRRIAVFSLYRGALYPGFALAAAMSKPGCKPPAFIRGQSGHTVVQFNGRNLDVGNSGEILLNFGSFRRTFVHYSAYELLAASKAGAFAGKIVVIGISAQGIGESMRGPLGLAFSSAEVQATAIDNVTSGNYFTKPIWSTFVEIASIVFTAYLTVWLLFRFPALLGSAVALAFAAGMVVCSGVLLAVSHAFVSPVPALGACVGGFVICAGRIFLMHGRVGRESREELAVANRFITSALGAMTALRDVETGQHVVRIQGYLHSLCKEVASNPRFKDYLTEPMIDLLVQLAPIHDIGKVGVPDYILRKPGALTTEEFQQMKSHVTLGKRILEEAREQSGLRNELFFQTATDIVYSHHERWNGTGYPLGLSGDDIPIPGRLLAVADVYDALISKRHYKPEFLHSEAVEQICKDSGRHFDPDIVEAFLSVHEDWRRMAEAHRDEPGLAAAGR